MGPKHFSYTPDFRVAGLSIPDSHRPLFIEVKGYPNEDMDLTKYVRFTEWYGCDLLVLAIERGDVLSPENMRYCVVLRCKRCDDYFWFPCDEWPTDDYIRQQIDAALPFIGRAWEYPRKKPPPALAFRLACDGKRLSEQAIQEYRAGAANVWQLLAALMPCRSQPTECMDSPVGRTIVSNYFLIQAGELCPLSIRFRGGETEATTANVSAPAVQPSGETERPKRNGLNPQSSLRSSVAQRPRLSAKDREWIERQEARIDAMLDKLERPLKRPRSTNSFLNQMDKVNAAIEKLREREAKALASQTERRRRRKS